MAALEVGDMLVDFGPGGTKLTVSQSSTTAAVDIRNRGGEELGNMLSRNPQIAVLDISNSGMRDNGLSFVCLSVRRSDQLEEAYFGNVGHHGFDFVLGVVERCNRLKKLHVDVIDVPTLNANRQTIEAKDYDTADHAKAVGDDEEGNEEEGDEETPEQKAEKLKKVWLDNGYDSEEEAELEKQKKLKEEELKAKQNRAAGLPVEEKPPEPEPVKTISPHLAAQLRKLVETAHMKQNLIEIECGGDCPDDIKYELQRVVAEHQAIEAKKANEKESQNVHGALTALKDQMEELNQALNGSTTEKSSKGFLDLDDVGAKMSLDIRTYVNRRLFAVLGEALFECQRFKSKGNEAVSTPEGEMAFISMYIHRHIAEMKESKSGARGGFAVKAQEAS